MSEPHSPESPRQKTTTGRVDDRTLSLLYLNGTSPYVDLATTQLLAEVSRNVRITTVANAVDAHATLQKATGDGRFHGLLLSPTLSAEYALQLVTTFREDRVPVAIVPVVTEAHHGLCTNAVAAGADAVLLLLNGVLVSPEETLDRIWDSPHVPEDEPQAVAVGAGRRAFERLQTLFLRPKTNGHATAGDANASDATPDDGRVRLRALLNEAHVARVRTESVLGLEKPAKQSSSDVGQRRASLSLQSDHSWSGDGGIGGRTRPRKPSSTTHWKTRSTRARSSDKRSINTVVSRPHGTTYVGISKRGRTTFTPQPKRRRSSPPASTLR